MVNNQYRERYRLSKLNDLLLDEWVDLCRKSLVKPGRGLQFWKLRKFAEKYDLTITDTSDLNKFGCEVRPRRKQLITGVHFAFFDHPIYRPKHELWEKVRDWIEKNGNEVTDCPGCADCRRKVSPPVEFRYPDANNYQGTPAYLRDLISQTGMTMEDCADACGVKLRAMQRYCSHREASQHPYSLEFAMECLAAKMGTLGHDAHRH